jgi:hypothetical protein
VTAAIKPTRPRNQIGQPATATPAEAIVRLTAKLSKNHGSANRARIRAQISAEQALQAG